MSQLCPKCNHDNPDYTKVCNQCTAPLRGLLGANTVLVERYEIIKVLGCGAMGAVYLAHDKRLPTRRWAIKENRPDININTELLNLLSNQFLAEARLLAQLDHPALPKVSDYFLTEHEREYLVMDYVEGDDLLTLLQHSNRPLAEAQVLDWADQVLDALSYLHNQDPQPIIHRDIKPANLRLTPQGRIKLVDFGLFKLFDPQQPETKFELRGIGTPAYAPIEQFISSEHHTDARSDIYALGATLYHLLTNRPPSDVHQRILAPEKLTPPRQFNPNLSANTQQAILQAIEIQPDQRYQSAQEMRDALAGTDTYTTTTLPEINVSAAATRTGRDWRRLLTWAGLILIMFILAGSLFIVFQGDIDQANGSQLPAVTVSPQATVPNQTSTPTPEISETVTILGEEVAIIIATPTATLTPSPVPATPRPATAAPTPLTLTGPALIPDQTLTGVIAYPVFNGTDYDLYLGQVDGSGTRLFRSKASQPAFSPDGTRIAFHSWELDTRGLMTMDLSGANLSLVTAYVEDQLPSWSADSSTIIFLTRRSGGRQSRLYQVASSGDRGEVLLLGEGEYPTVGLNDRLVFKGWGNTGFGLQLTSLATDTPQAITEFETDTAPALSPDGQKIAFMSRRDGNWEIYTANIDGSSLHRLTQNPARDGLPTWSPDGQALAFVSNRDGAWAIWAMTPAGQDQRRLWMMEGSLDGFVGTDRYASRGWTEERINWTDN